MKLEDEIRQVKFSSEYQKLAVNIHFTESWLRGKEQSLFKKYGISMQQFNVLRILKGKYPNKASVQLIKDRMIDKDSNASRLIDKLYAAKYVDRMQCPDDRRKVEVIITGEGLQLLESISPEIHKMQQNELRLSELEAETLNNLLDKLRTCS